MPDADDDVGDMKISTRDFQRIHGAAQKAEGVVRVGNLDKLPTKELMNLYDALRAADTLNDFEDGPDLAFVHSYDESITLLRRTICDRK